MGGDLFHEYDYKYTSDPTESDNTNTNLVGMKLILKKRIVLGIENFGTISFSGAHRPQKYTDPTIPDNTYWSQAFKFNSSINVPLFVGFNS